MVMFVMKGADENYSSYNTVVSLYIEKRAPAIEKFVSWLAGFRLLIWSKQKCN
jgi:hypothetical protein